MLTSEPDMIDAVSVLGSLGASDHNMLEWEVQLSPMYSIFNRTCLDYGKADLPAIRQALNKCDWDAVLQGDANDQCRSKPTHLVIKKLLG